MTISIFFDLETTSRYPIGQIINYSFITVDDSYQIQSELSGKIRLSRLQLPEPGAILTNRTDILKHQQETEQSELQAMQEIYKYINGVIRKARAKVILVGYNSSKFDIPYLRTSLIRNGLNPYFGGKILYRDLLFCSRKLSITHPEFPRRAALSRDPEKLSLSLETLTTALGLLRGDQTHESRDDVLLTIEYAKTLQEQFQLNFRIYEAFEFQKAVKEKSQLVLESRFPQYDLQNSALYQSAPVCLLDADARYSLWVNLDRYEQGEGKQSIQWLNHSASAFFNGNKNITDSKYLKLSEKAYKEFQKIHLRNFFETSTCDIEQDIYRLDFSAIEALEDAIWKKNTNRLNKLKGRDAKVAHLRHQLSNYQWGSGDDLRIEEMLRKYALYRYGGDAQLSRFAEDKEKTRMHPTLKELFNEVENIQQEAQSAEDKALLKSLINYYRKSDIYRLASKELLS